MPARGQFSLNRRTKPSNFSEVGQIRRSSGISTKMRTTPVTLEEKQVSLRHCGEFSIGEDHVQADDGEDDEERGMEDVCNSQCNTD